MTTATQEVETIVTKQDVRETARTAKRANKDNKEVYNTKSGKGGYKRTVRNNPRYNYDGE